MQPPLSRDLFALLREMASRRVESLAVLTPSDRITYAGLLARAEAVAAGLTSFGIAPGDRVGLLAGNGIEWLEVLFGTAGAGATLVPFSTWSTREELEFLIDDAGITALIAQKRFGDRDFASDVQAIAKGRTQLKVVLITEEQDTPFARYDVFRDGAPKQAVRDIDHAARDALVLYTSGSSSRPKAVRLVHRDIIENGFNIGERQGLIETDRVLLSSPLFWAFGGINALPATFTHGATLVVQEKFDAGVALDLIETHACTAIYSLPSIANALLRHPDFSRRRTGSLRTGVALGSPQDIARVAEDLGAAEVCNIYGLTETYGNCCVTDHGWPLRRRAECQGLPLPGVTLRIVDPDTGEKVPNGQVGSVEVGGYVTPGYSGASAAENATAFTADGYFRTGDIGQLTERGEFVFVGRSTDMIKKASINLSPVEIEELLLRHPDVAQACVVGAPDAEKGEIVVAFVVPAAGTAPSEQVLVRHCREHASKYKVPDRIVFRDALPVTVTGKLLRRQLRNDALELAGTQGAAA